MQTTANANEVMDASRAKLFTDVQAVIADVEDYLAASGGQSKEAAAAARVKLERTLGQANERIGQARREVARNTRMVARRADGYVHRKPWQSIAVGVGAGLVAGLLLARRSA